MIKHFSYPFMCPAQRQNNVAFNAHSNTITTPEPSKPARRGELSNSKLYFKSLYIYLDKIMRLVIIIPRENSVFLQCTNGGQCKMRNFMTAMKLRQRREILFSLCVEKGITIAV